MNPQGPSQTQSFFGTLEQCVEQFGGGSQFTVSDPVTFFSGARSETHRRAQSKDGTVVIVERQLAPTTCEVYLPSSAMRAQSARAASATQSRCA